MTATILLTHPTAAAATYYGDEALAGLAALGRVLRNPGEAPFGTAELIAAAADCDVIVSDRQTPGAPELFRALPKLAAFVRCAVDIRNVAVAAADAEGILVTQASPGFVSAVAEMAFGLIVDCARGISRSVAAYRAGGEPQVRMGRQLNASTLGVIGYGAIGREVCRLGRAFGMRVLANDPHVAIDGAEAVDLATLLAESDFVLPLAVATPATENLIDAAAFARMKPTAWLVNLSRGNLVDETALEAALDQRRIAGAAMDVGRAPDQMPSPGLARRADVIATPHIAGLTRQAVDHQALETVRQVGRILKGEAPPGAVNPGQATRYERFRP